LRDAYSKFENAELKLYAISYDDQKVLREFTEKQKIPFPLLSDIDSRVIREYGILNDRIESSDAFLYGIPYPGVYVTDENGVVIAKFFHDTYKKRDSPEVLIDAALGRVEVDPDTPSATTADSEVKIRASVHGGRGTIRQGIRRQLVIRFEPTPGFHLYGEPVPDGMVATRVDIKGPPGLVVEDPILPPTKPLELKNLGVELQVYSGVFDIIVPFYADGRLASEVRPLDLETAEVEITVRYQACDDHTCLLPKTETLTLDLPLDVIDVPALGLHMGHGQREGNFKAAPHLRRMIFRVLRRNPLDLLRYLAKNIRLTLAAHRRQG